MGKYDYTYISNFFLIIVLLELVIWPLRGIILKHRIKKWVNNSYQSLEPGSFNKRWTDDIRYYIILAILVVYSFWGKHDVLTVALINVYLIANAIIHLTMRSSKIISVINKLQIDEKGIHLDKKIDMWNWVNIYLTSVKKWFDEKINIINDRISNGVEICRHNKYDGLYYLDNIADIKFSRDEFINIRSQSIYSNIIFFLHLLAVIVINLVLLLNITKSGIITDKSFTTDAINAPYAILQAFSTIGFGDVGVQTLMGKWFFIIIFIQVILTIILGVVYKDFAINMTVIRFDEIVKSLNTAIDDYKKTCIVSILAKELPYNSFEAAKKEQYFFSQIVFDRLNEYVKKKDDGEKNKKVQIQHCLLKDALNCFSNILKC